MNELIHPHLANLVGILTLAIWLHLFFGRGWFWRVRKLHAEADRPPSDTPREWPSVVAIVPARNEAATIAQVVAALVRQDYPGPFSVVIVDDHSEDGTATIARQAANENSAKAHLSIVSASPLSEGWTGKLWALHEGVSRAAGIAEVDMPNGGVPSPAASALPEFYWFTDADISHAPNTLTRLAARAVQEKLDLASLMVLLQAKTFPERALIPAFLYFFLMLYPPRWIADEELGTAGAAGGCILLRREALARIGGFAAIRGALIDDCALAKAVKLVNGRVWMGLTRKSTSLRAYGTFGEIRDLIARTAFTQLRYLALVLAATLLGMFLTYAAPVILLFAHDATARMLGFAAWLLMSLSFLPTVRFYRLTAMWTPLLPLIAMFYSYATWLSAVRYWMGKGGLWKGRAQAPKELA